MLGYSRPPAKPASQRTRAITATKVVPWVPVKSVDLGPSFTGGYNISDDADEHGASEGSAQLMLSRSQCPWLWFSHIRPGSEKEVDAPASRAEPQDGGGPFASGGRACLRARTGGAMATRGSQETGARSPAFHSAGHRTDTSCGDRGYSDFAASLSDTPTVLELLRTGNRRRRRPTDRAKGSANSIPITWR